MQTAQTAPAGKFVVVIDDDTLVLEAMSGLLRSWGFEVAAAPSDTAVLAELRTRGKRPDLIICDYRLSEGRSGIDAIERLRKTFEVPAFLITAEAALQRLDVARASQFLMLHKPVDPTKLQASIYQALNLGDIPRERT
jgi:two-component system, sensor histidine kinase